MYRSWKFVLGLVALIGVGELAAMSEAAARRGSSPMNSPGYQRRLQESRGYVTNRSVSVPTPPYAGPYEFRRYDRGGRRLR